MFAICDEVAKWTDNVSGANPAAEVLASLRPAMAGAGQPRRRRRRAYGAQLITWRNPENFGTPFPWAAYSPDDWGR